MKWLPYLKKTLVLILGLLACTGYSQSNFFTSLKIEATVVVKQHSMGSDLVEITILGPDYPERVLEEKVATLGKEVGDEPRGVQVSAIEGGFMKCTFAVNGLITQESPKVNVAAIARALAFGDRPIRSFSVFFDGLNPDSSIPARYFAEKDAWLMEGLGMKSPRGIEYRVKVNTSDPNQVMMPGKDQKMPKAPDSNSGGGSKLFIFGGIIVGAFAIGLLVYSALLRPRPSGK